MHHGMLTFPINRMTDRTGKVSVSYYAHGRYLVSITCTIIQTPMSLCNFRQQITKPNISLIMYFSVTNVSCSKSAAAPATTTTDNPGG